MTDLDRLRTHARTIVEGEGAEEFSPALMLAVETAIRQAVYDQVGTYIVGGDCFCARAALSTICKHQAGE